MTLLLSNLFVPFLVEEVLMLFLLGWSKVLMLFDQKRESE